MIIEKLNIINFSGTANTVIDLKNGINIIEGKNESGKSTISAFIKFMLYGFTDKAERMRFYSFGTNTASGTMTVSVNNGKYRIDRTYTEGSPERLRVVNLNTGMTENGITAPGYMFLGVPERVFSASAFVGQADSGNIGGEKLSAAIENMLFSGDESTGTEKALKKLDEARVRLLHKNHKGGAIYDMCTERDKLHVRLEKAKSDNAALIEKEGTLRETRAKIAENRTKLQDLSEKIQYYNAAKLYREILKYNELDEKANLAREEYLKFKSETEKNGFIPSEELISKLNDLDKRSAELESEYNKANYDLAEHNSKAHEVQLISSQIQKVSSFGGEDGIRNTLLRADKAKKRLSFFGYLSLVISLIFGAFSAVIFATPYADKFLEKLPFSKSVSGIISGAVAVTFFAVMILMFVAKSNQNMIESDILLAFDVEDRDDLDDILSKLNYSHVLMTMHQTKSHEFREKISSLESEIAELKEETENTIRPIGAETVREAVSVVLKTMAKEESLLGNAEKYALARDTMGTRLSDEETEKITKILNGRPYAQESFNESETENSKKQYDFYSCSTELLEEKEKQLEKEIAVLNATVEAPTALADSLLCLSRDIEKATKQHRALVLANEALNAAAADLRSSIAPRLSRRAGEIVAAVTDSRYTSIGVGDKLQMEYTANDGMNHGIEYMSFGTRETAYISLRFALTEILFNREKPPVIFDESFACIDDERLSKILMILSEMEKDGMQILLFTSQSRDANCAREAKLDFNRIIL